MSKETKAKFLFAGFAFLLAFRDIARELLKENVFWFTFTICATIVTFSSIYAVFTKQYGLIKKIKTPGALPRAIAFGSVSGAIYLGIFYLIQEWGAGIWGLIDYGLIPLATAIVGVLMFNEKLSRDFFGAFIIYALGVTILIFYKNNSISMLNLSIAILLPIISALSDGWAKWLLKDENAGLTRSELLVVRFIPALIVVYIVAIYITGSYIPKIEQPFPVILVGIIGGWLPLILLYIGLEISELKKLAVWEFMIPVTTFFGTLHMRPENLRIPIIGAAILMLLGIVISEGKLVSRLTGKKKLNFMKLDTKSLSGFLPMIFIILFTLSVSVLFFLTLNALNDVASTLDSLGYGERYIFQSETFLYAIITMIFAGIGTISSLIFNLLKEIRDNKETKLKIEKLELELQELKAKAEENKFKLVV